MSIAINKPSFRLNEGFFYISALSYLLICRLLAMYFLPLNDTTESRYGEIARKMLETGNWVTPLHDYNEPFWAKPPLSTWLSALSMKLFGVNEFAVRLPALFLSVAVLYLLWILTNKQRDRSFAQNTILILASTFYFVLDAGTVMTDPSLLFSTTLVMVSFWLAVEHQSKGWGYLFFIGLGLGLLAKGPIALVLTGLPLFIWVILNRKWSDLWERLPWFSGFILMLATALPWYLLAESRTPGFLYYFIVGEHFFRFLVPSWGGDRYGIAHQAHLGAIWGFAFLGFLPWSLIGPAWLIRHLKSFSFRIKKPDPWLSYLLLFIVMPLVFFSFAHNVIYTYTFPVLPAFAVLVVECSSRLGLVEGLRTQLNYTIVIVGLIFLGAVLLFQALPKDVAKTQKPVIALWNKQPDVQGQHLIYWAPKPLYSAQFYSQGKIKALFSEQALCDYLSRHADHYLVVNNLASTPLPDEIRLHLTKLESIKIVKDEFTLYRTQAGLCA